ncbi:hypothetical protein EG329_010301 [Mollisiaceae sp. DMI_Dod_QoI]|nr:hypothetical protein EG329_010301 [Helotiales sp. DMI_Dod_QoI]
MQSFTLFPNLLPELRVLIWQQALQHPRLVLIYRHCTRTTTSAHVRRVVSTALLSVSRESRLEALKYYFPSSLVHPNSTIPLQPQPATLFPNFLCPPIWESTSTSRLFPIGPGTDIIYISGSDPPPPSRRSTRTPVTWTLNRLSSDLESSSPSFSPIKNLAIDLELLLSTPFSKTPKFKMPNGVWKFILYDLRVLERVFVVRSSDGCQEEMEGEEKKWEVGDVERKLLEARGLYVEFWEGMAGYGDEEEGEDGEGGAWEEVARLKSWMLPSIDVLELEELVARCWV